MRRVAWVIAIVMSAMACSARRPAGPSLTGPMDGGALDDAGVPGDTGPGTGPADGAVDAATDPTDLAMICGGTAPITLDDWENCYQKRKCEWEVGCVTLDTFRDVPDCVASADAVSGGKLAAARRARKRAIEQGRASINVDAFTRCLIRTDATHCNTALYDPACLTRFTGTIADGKSCYTSIDCASPDAACNTDCADACCLGSCERKLREGESCLLFDSCEPGLRCTGTRCVSGDAGTPCARGSVNQCDFGTFCDRQTLRCTPTLAPDATCTSLLQCGGDHTCVGLSITSSDPGRCLRISRPGDRCDDFCFGNLYCDGASRTCRELPTLGQSCSVLIPCTGANTICNSGLCALRDDINVSCAGQTCLPGLFCTSELGDPAPVCAARRAAGAPCASPAHCQSYLCSGDQNQPGMCLPWSNTCPG
jgi:hypothetical protein